METQLKNISKQIKDLKSTLPQVVLEKHFELNPKLKERYNQFHIENYLNDTSYHLTFLAEAILLDEQELFNQYLAWLKQFFDNLPVPEEDLIQNFLLVKENLRERIDGNYFSKIEQFWNNAIQFFKDYKVDVPSFINDDNPYKDLAEKYLNLLLDANKTEALDLILKAYYSGITLKELYLNVFQVTQKETGRLWQLNKISVAQEHYITAATQLIISQLYPFLFSGLNKKRKILVTCAQGELHEIGARMIADFFEMDGWNSYFLGANTPINSLISSINKIKPDLVAISTTMTFNLSSTSFIIEKIKSDNSLNNLKIIVGGYPFLISENLWKKVGADGFAPNAENALQLANEFVN
ncbi:MAG: cobalamin-dependent protein [Melioribacteraceae bacterium]|nr:cobalamin-dependent protein [Melioribacteraceae bacterium]